MLPWQRYDNNKMVAMRYHGNDDVSSVTHAGCLCAPVNAITACYTQIGPYKAISKKVVRVTTMWLCDGRKNNITSSVCDCTVEDVEYIYNKLSLHIFNSKRRQRVIDVFYIFNNTVID